MQDLDLRDALANPARDECNLDGALELDVIRSLLAFQEAVLHDVLLDRVGVQPRKSLEDMLCDRREQLAARKINLSAFDAAMRELSQ